ncbi:MAG: DedA family protein [Phycisphaerales bacterium]|nr:DedA family protein [Phycisphaerales bacterium]
MFLRLFTDLDTLLAEFVRDYGVWTYVLLFAIVFCETGLVVLPLLPGDSLLFAMGAIAAIGDLDVRLIALIIFVAALAGDNLNYRVGRIIGPRAFSGKMRWLKKSHLERTQQFFDKHGTKAIILARFAPVVRTFAPFVAGVGAMPYWRFLLSSVIGATLWVVLFVGAGYLFGNLPFVKANFSKFVLLIIVVSIMPLVWGWWSSRRTKRGEMNAP